MSYESYLNQRKQTASTDVKQIKGDCFTLRCQFQNGGFACKVENPRFRMMPVDEVDYIPFSSVDSYQLDMTGTLWALNDNVDYYSITIDPTLLAHGWYSVVFEGDYTQGGVVGVIKLEGKVEIAQLSRADRIINQVLNLIADDDIDGYLHTAGKWHKFRQSTMLGFVPMGISFINVQPIRKESWTIESLPEDYEYFLVQFIVAQCMFKKARIAIDNDMYLSDNKSLQQNKHALYKSMFDSMIAGLKQEIKDHKISTPSMAMGFNRNRFPSYAVFGGIMASSRTFFIGGTLNVPY